jgi:UPF0271 protein
VGLLKVDLNSDMGESSNLQEFHRDECLTEYVTSANVSCGVHAGTDEFIERTLSRCRDLGVGVGAHPSFNDRKGFGRREMEVDKDTLERELNSQVLHLKVISMRVGVELYHLKPHGALYNMAWRRRDYSEVISRVARLNGLAILAPAGSAMIEEAAKEGVRYFNEGFAERNYRRDGTLVPRSHPDSLIVDPSLAAERALRIVEGLPIITNDGGSIELTVQSLCIHSDTPGSCIIAQKIKERLLGAGVKVVTLRDLTPVISGTGKNDRRTR